MSLGTYGSTLLSELNRLANGGTYPPVNTMDEASAAKAWAAYQGVPLTVSDTVGVLNEIAGLSRDQWLDYSGVCNYLAGTTDLPAAAALRQITGAPSKPVVTGGTLSAYNGYFYRAFTSTADLGIENETLDAEVLVIGGGGSGGYGSGGGAGGVLIQSLTLQPGNYTATVGAGGAINSYYANPGSNSSFASITALGGSGQTIDGQPPTYGGSGAGGMGGDATFGYGTSGQGFNGGAHAFRSGGGGGGAAGPGSNAGNYVGSNGGQAILLQDWANATGLGVNGYFAGGGGGSGQYGNGTGGGGGAGDGGAPSSAAATAVANTGSGAGSRYGYQSGAGGSGLVIVRYLQTAV